MRNFFEDEMNLNEINKKIKSLAKRKKSNNILVAVLTVIGALTIIALIVCVFLKKTGRLCVCDIDESDDCCCEEDCDCDDTCHEEEGGCYADDKDFIK